MEHVLQTSLELPLPRDEVFAFFADAGNLERITPPELRFRFVSALPVAMEPGALIAYRLRLFGVSFGWRTCIAVWEPPARFVDVQVHGPYALWEHTHTFTAVDGDRGEGTRIDDRVRYRLPLAPLGDVAHPLVRRQLERIFDYRAAAVCAALLSQTGAAGARHGGSVAGATAGRDAGDSHVKEAL